MTGASGQGSVDAGTLGAWLRGFGATLAGTADAEVPCGTCTACCRSSQFVHIGPDETETLARIPRALLFPAPRLPEGHVLLGYDEDGRCPMLGEAGCTIYEHRPRTCRTYDCRVFAATSIAPDVDQPLVAERVVRWRFDITSADDERALRTVRAATAAVEASADAPAHPTARAVRAVRDAIR